MCFAIRVLPKHKAGAFEIVQPTTFSIENVGVDSRHKLFQSLIDAEVQYPACRIQARAQLAFAIHGEIIGVLQPLIYGTCQLTERVIIVMQPHVYVGCHDSTHILSS